MYFVHGPHVHAQTVLVLFIMIVSAPYFQHCRTVVRVAFIAVPIVVLCYLLVNLSFFAVLSYEQLESAEAVGLVRIIAYIIYLAHYNNAGECKN